MKTKKFHYLAALLVIALSGLFAISCSDDDNKGESWISAYPAPFEGVWKHSNGFTLTINNDNTFTMYDPNPEPGDAPHSKGTFIYSAGKIVFTFTDYSMNTSPPPPPSWTPMSPGFGDVMEMPYKLEGTTLTLTDLEEDDDIVLTKQP